MRQKKLERRLTIFFIKNLVREVSKYYWELFEALKAITEKEMASIVIDMEPEDFWNECSKFLVDKGYVDG